MKETIKEQPFLTVRFLDEDNNLVAEEYYTPTRQGSYGEMLDETYDWGADMLDYFDAATCEVS